MGREECERAIIAKMKEIREIYEQYNPDGRRLSLFYIDDHYSVDNSYRTDDSDHPISAWESEEHGFVQNKVVMK